MCTCVPVCPCVPGVYACAAAAKLLCSGIIKGEREREEENYKGKYRYWGEYSFIDRFIAFHIEIFFFLRGSTLRYYTQICSSVVGLAQLLHL